MTVELDNAQTPLYKKVYLALVRRIDDETYEANSMLPSESELQDEFEVSRITVRRSLQELELAGYVRREHGKGTFVLPRIPYSNLVGAMSFSQEAIKSGERPSSIILEFEEVKSSGLISDYLQINEGTKVYYLKRLRLKNGRIIGLNETYISSAINFAIKADTLDERTSIYELYEQHGIVIDRATETIEALMPSSELKQTLYMKTDEPVFKRERITYDHKNMPIEYSINSYRANEYKYIIELRRE